MMKRLWTAGAAAALALSLAGCGTGTDVDEPAADENTPASEQPAGTSSTDSNTTDTPAETAGQDTGEQKGSPDEMKTKMDQLSLKEIELEISYGSDREYEAEIEQDRNEPVQPKVEDEVNGQYLNGQEAFDDLYPKVEQLDLTKDSTKEETIDQVLKAFGLEADYEKFEVEIHFNDGSKLDVEDKK